MSRNYRPNLHNLPADHVEYTRRHIAESLLRRYHIMRQSDETRLFCEFHTNHLIVFVVNLAQRDQHARGAVAMRPGGSRETYANHYMFEHASVINEIIDAQTDSSHFYAAAGKVGDTNTVHDNTHFLEIIGVLNPLIAEVMYRNVHAVLIEGVRRLVRENSFDDFVSRKK